MTTVSRIVFCMSCGVDARRDVPAPDDYGRNGTTVDGTPMPGWCDAAQCLERRQAFNETAARILSGRYEEA